MCTHSRLDSTHATQLCTHTMHTLTTCTTYTPYYLIEQPIVLLEDFSFSTLHSQFPEHKVDSPQALCVTFLVYVSTVHTLHLHMCSHTHTYLIMVFNFTQRVIKSCGEVDLDSTTAFSEVQLLRTICCRLESHPFMAEFFVEVTVFAPLLFLNAVSSNTFTIGYYTINTPLLY